MGSSYVEVPHAVALMTAFLSFSIGCSFMLVFDTVGDTILYCFAHELKRKGHIDSISGGKEEKAGLLSCLSSRHSGVDESSDAEEEPGRYAPRRLQALIEYHRRMSMF